MIQIILIQLFVAGLWVSGAAPFTRWAEVAKLLHIPALPHILTCNVCLSWWLCVCYLLFAGDPFYMYVIALLMSCFQHIILGVVGMIQSWFIYVINKLTL